MLKRDHGSHRDGCVTCDLCLVLQKTKEEAKKAREKGIVMYAVGIGKLGEELSEDELLGIAGDRSRMLIADNYAKLNTIREQLTTITCSGSECARIFVYDLQPKNEVQL